MKLIKVEASAPLGLEQSLKDNVHADLVPESEAIGHRAGNAVNPDTLALDVVLLDSEIEQWRRMEKLA